MRLTQQDTHFYDEAGEHIPGIGRIIKAAGLGIDYSKVPPDRLEHARNRGSYVDECITLLESGELELDRVHDEARPYLDAWCKFKWEERYEPIHMQRAVWHPELRVVGIPDSHGRLRGQLCTPDIKCTWDVDRSYGLQVAFYTMPGLRYVDTDEEVPPSSRLIVQLKRDGTYKPWPFTDPNDYAVVRAMAQAYHAARIIEKWKAA